MGEPSQRNPGLFEKHPATGQHNLIQYHPWMEEYLLAAGYAEAAKRLAASYRAQPWDDVILLPFLFVWRQAIELVLKDAIRRLARWRREGGDQDPELAAKVVNEKLRGDIGHKISGLRIEVRRHLDALGAEQLPERTEAALQLLEGVDNRGTSFRYAGLLKSGTADLNIETLNAQLHDTFEICSVIVDAATNGEG